MDPFVAQVARRCTPHRTSAKWVLVPTYALGCTFALPRLDPIIRHCMRMCTERIAEIDCIVVVSFPRREWVPQPIRLASSQAPTDALPRHEGCSRKVHFRNDQGARFVGSAQVVIGPH